MSASNRSQRGTRRWAIVVGGVLVALIVLAALAWALIAAGVLPTPDFLAKRPAATPSPAATRDARWQQDIDYLGSQVAYLHVNAFHRVTRETFDSQVKALAERVSTLNDDQIVVEMLRLVASIGDGHTSAYPHWSIGYRRLPIRVFWFSDGLFVTEATAAYTQALGAKVVRIGSADVSAVLDALTALVPHDNDSDLLGSSTLFLTTPEILYGLGFIASRDTATFTFEGQDGAQFTLDLPALPVDGETQKFVSLAESKGLPAPVSGRNREQYYWFEVLPDSQTLFFQYNQCDEIKNQPFADFNKTLFAALDSQPIQRVVLDLRYNSGGNERILQPFIDGMLSRAAFNTKQRFFVLIGRDTYSSALGNALTLKARSNATFIGEPTGGKPNHFGEVRQFRLPNSRLIVQYPTRYWLNLRDSDPPSLMPDISAPPTMEAAIAGRDPALEAALQ